MGTSNRGMESGISLLLLAGLTQVGSAAPLRLHNRIVFTRGNWVQGAETVWTMNANGAEQKCVWRVPEGQGQFGGFSRDSKKALSFDTKNLYVHDLSTKKSHRVLLWVSGLGSYIKQPSFSPDGKWILCEVGESSQNASDSLVLRLEAEKSYSVVNGLKAQTLHPVKETVPAENVWSSPRWNCNGKQMVVVGGPRYSFNSFYSKTSTLPVSQIWTMNADGTNARQITHTLIWNQEPALSPDGGAIVFVRSVKTSYSDLGEYSSNLVKIDIASGTQKDLTTLPEVFDELAPSRLPPIVSNPLFSPTGTQIAFEKDARGNHSGTIYRIDIRGENRKMLGSGNLVQWMP